MDFSFFSSLPLASLNSIIGAWIDSDGFGHFIVLIHAVCSVTAVAISIEQKKKFKIYSEVSSEFLKHIRKIPYLLFYHLNQKDDTNNPAIAIYTAATERLMTELKQHNTIIETVEDAYHITLSSTSLNFVKVATEESLTQQIHVVEGKMGWLASIATLAPLLGLLGTVMGVLDAFQSMGAKGTVNLSDVAPGLSSAMLTTVSGLFVAIISAFMYNWLLSEFRKISAVLDAFADEYIARSNAEFGPKQ